MDEILSGKAGTFGRFALDDIGCEFGLKNTRFIVRDPD